MPPSELEAACLRDRVQTRSSKRIDASRDALFDTRPAPVGHLAGVFGLRNLFTLLRADPPTHLNRAVPEVMTVSETSFFRDPGLFEALRSTILPELIHLRASTRRLRIWSAACSTGQETFSVAILLAELLPSLADWDIKILGTDLSHQAVDYAERGRFRRNEVQRGLPPELLARCFTEEGDEWAVQPRIAALCHFRHLNLCTPSAHLPRFDLILLRNVLLYVSPGDCTAVLRHMHDQLVPEGYLILGDAEQAEDFTSLFEPHAVGDTYVYRPVNNP
jgi:chemotaxis protein methyltransferase CheR